MTKPSFDDLQGKVCAITGGGGVIGRALAEGLAAVGTQVAVIDLFKNAANACADAVQTQYGVKAIGVEGNVLETASLEKALEQIHKELGPINLLINGAGGNSPKATTQAEFFTPDLRDQVEKTFYGLEIEGFRKVFDPNFLGTILPTTVLTRDMLAAGKGSVLNISSMNAFRPLTKIPAYSAAKASINNFTQWLAVHLAPMSIRVNAIAPGFFLTNQNRFLLTDENTGELTPRGHKIMDSTPMGKFGELEDLKGATLYLLSDISSFVTGIVIPVDGGFSAYSGV